MVELPVKRLFEARIKALSSPGQPPVLHGGLRGVEKESLRVTADGYIAATDHPRALGSALTNRFITTDYSEALLEFVTPARSASWQVIQFLCDIHQFVFDALDGELLWPMSMPCLVRSEQDIPIARYGTSNIAEMKMAYRRGLGHRYGRYMQAISGLHFNYSLPQQFWEVYRDVEKSRQSGAGFRSTAYLGLVRNIRRLDWLLLYLFGASPAICKCFLDGRDTALDELDSGSYFGPWATTLRMSDLGYQHVNQSDLHVSANSLDEYIGDLVHAISTPDPRYQAIGIKVDGVYRQLNANRLQIENEYYSTVRPKRVARSGERPTAALQRAGIEYVEIRALDVSPFDPIGISHKEMKFLEAFAVYCLLADSPPIDLQEEQDIADNRILVAGQGRRPGLQLQRNGEATGLRDWGREICERMIPVCELLDQGPEQGYVTALRACQQCVDDPEQTPSSKVISDVRAQRLSLFEYAMQLACRYRDYFAELQPELNQNRDALARETRESLARQEQMERMDSLPFDAYLAQYFA